LPAILRLVLAYAALLLGLVPLAWLLSLWRGGRRFPSLWWWVAAAYGVSFLADVLGFAWWRGLRWVDPWLVSGTYPVSQAGILGFVLLPYHAAGRFLMALVLATILGGMFAVGVNTVPLRVVAWGTVVVLAWPRRDLGALRLALLVSFGLGLLGWLSYVGWPSFGAWAALQGTRVVGTGCYCWGALKAPGGAYEL